MGKSSWSYKSISGEVDDKLFFDPISVSFSSETLEVTTDFAQFKYINHVSRSRRPIHYRRWNKLYILKGSR
ncbi:hypothetical protein NQ317_010265 [Molorchus minor]|uniref:Uncharacterized protein n=1 Tax=Molorchus minor TaxID=1323400 RepID=A0ABQ9JDP5_9CUCU|nr:hypothetical protein NQ317_010265 [Molorchus minor]